MPAAEKCDMGVSASWRPPDPRMAQPQSTDLRTGESHDVISSLKAKPEKPEAAYLGTFI